MSGTVKNARDQQEQEELRIWLYLLSCFGNLTAFWVGIDIFIV